MHMNKGRFCNNSKIDTPIFNRLSVENKAKLFQLEANNTVDVFQNSMAQVQVVKILIVDPNSNLNPDHNPNKIVTT